MYENKNNPIACRSSRNENFMSSACRLTQRPTPYGPGVASAGSEASASASAGAQSDAIELLRRTPPPETAAATEDVPAAAAAETDALAEPSSAGRNGLSIVLRTAEASSTSTKLPERAASSPACGASPPRGASSAKGARRCRELRSQLHLHLYRILCSAQRGDGEKEEIQVLSLIHSKCSGITTQKLHITQTRGEEVC